ncbi:phage adaptor protein [Paenibacillus chitinolyticus]
MTIGEIIEEADERIPNALSVKSKVRKINNRESELFRGFLREKSATVYDIIQGQFLYPLDFYKGKIITVIINGRRYTYEEIDDEFVQPPYIYTFQNSIGIYPPPEMDIPGGMLIYHFKEPRKYVETDTGRYPDFDPDYHMLHVYGLCADIASVQRKFEVANGYIGQYNDLLQGFKRSRTEPELTRMRVE